MADSISFECVEDPGSRLTVWGDDGVVDFTLGDFDSALCVYLSREDVIRLHFWLTEWILSEQED